MTGDKTEAAISIAAALLVLFTALLNPIVSVILSVIALVALGIYHLTRK